MEEHFFKERGIYYRTNDIRPERTTLVFIHSLLSSSAFWLRYEQYFADKYNYNIVASDLRGHGKSLKPGTYDDYRIERMAEDINALLEHLKVGAYIPISSSLSSIVVLELLRKRPGAVAAIFLNPIYGTSDIFLTRISRGFVAACTRVAKLFNYSDTPGTHTDYASLGHVWDFSPKLLLREMWNTTLHVYLFCLDNLYKRNFDPWWSELKIPVLLLHGERDLLSPVAQIRRLAKTLPNAELIILPQGGHVMALNYVPEIQQIMTTYIQKVAPSQPGT